MAESFAKSLLNATALEQATSGSANLTPDAPDLPTGEVLSVIAGASITAALAGGPLAGAATLAIGTPALISDGYARSFQAGWNRSMAGFANLRGRYSGEAPLSKEEFTERYQDSPLEWEDGVEMTREAADLKLLSMHREAFVGRLESLGQTNGVATVMGNLLGATLADPTTYIGMAAGHRGALTLNKLVSMAKNSNNARKVGIGVGAAGSVLEIGGSVWAGKLASESIGDEFTDANVALAGVLGLTVVSAGAWMGLSRLKLDNARKAAETPVDGTVEVLAESIDEAVEMTVEEAERVAQTPVKVVREPEEAIPDSPLVSDGTEGVVDSPVVVKDPEDGSKVSFRNTLEERLHTIAKGGDGAEDAVEEVKDILVKAGFIDAAQRGGVSLDMTVREAAEVLELVVESHARREGSMTFLDDSGVPDVWDILQDVAEKVSADPDEIVAKIVPPKPAAVRDAVETAGEASIRESVEDGLTQLAGAPQKSRISIEQSLGKLLLREGFITSQNLTGSFNIPAQLELGRVLSAASRIYDEGAGDVNIWRALEAAGKQENFKFRKQMPPARTDAPSSTVKVPAAKPKIEASPAAKKRRRAAQGEATTTDADAFGMDQLNVRNELEGALHHLVASDTDEGAEAMREVVETMLMDAGFADDIFDLGVEMFDVITLAANRIREAALKNIEKGVFDMKGAPNVWKVLEKSALDLADGLDPHATQSVAEAFVEELNHKSAKASRDAVPEIATPRQADEVVEELERIKTENPDQADDIDSMAEAFDEHYQKGIQGCLV